MEGSLRRMGCVEKSVTMKVCSACGEEKEDSAFYKKGKWLQSRCKDCKKKANSLHYKENKSKYLANNAEFKAKRTADLGAIKEDKGCLVCGERHACCLDSHHLNPNEKEFGIASSYTLSWERLMTEIDKCVVLCKNCHAKVHAGIIDISRISSTVE